MERFERIYAEHADALRAYVRRRGPEAVVEDVVADTFVVCLRRIDEVPEPPLPWLYGVARKTLANERRRRERAAAPAADVAYEPEPPGDPVLAAAFAELSDGDREVLRLVAWEGLALREAAVVLGCSAVACRVRFFRAKTRLAALLDAPDSFPAEPKGALR
jgi:RNA polymerase sigma-70 factor (ECF subfamily)